MKDDRGYLLHIQDAIRRILDYTRDGQAFCMGDTKTQDAVIRNIEIIGEATKCLGDTLKAAHPEVPWRQIGGMRDTPIHRYFGVKLDLVWQVVDADLPKLQAEVESMLASLPPQPSAPGPATEQGG